MVYLVSAGTHFQVEQNQELAERGFLPEFSGEMPCSLLTPPANAGSLLKSDTWGSHIFPLFPTPAR